MNHYAYRIEHSESRRYYIGIRACRGPIEQDVYWGSGVLIRGLVAKYGVAAFAKTVLATFRSREEALSYEGDVVTLDLVADSLCLNLCIGGRAGIPEHKQRDDTRRKRSESCKAAFARRYPNGLPQEIRDRLSAAHKGRKQTPEHIAKAAATRVGKKKSAETRAKMRATALAMGRTFPEGASERGRQTILARGVSAETRAKMAASQRGRRMTAEATAKRVASYMRTCAARRAEARVGRA